MLENYKQKMDSLHYLPDRPGGFKLERDAGGQWGNLKREKNEAFIKCNFRSTLISFFKCNK